MRFAVFGSGGVGGYFGGRLAEAGFDVTFLARGRHLSALQTDGLRLLSPLGDVALHPVAATDDPAAIGPVDVVLVGVKAWQVDAAARAMVPLMGPETTVLPLQNGVEAPARLAERLGSGPVLWGLCRIMSFVAEPGVIRHAGIEPTIVLGELDNRRSERVARLAAALGAGRGVAVEIAADIHMALWRKFLLIAPWSGVGAFTQAPIGAIREAPDMRRLLTGAMMETLRVGQAHGVALPDDAFAQTLAFIDGLPYAGTASMQRDIAQGRPSELHEQTGTVVRLGEDVGVAVPTNSLIYDSLLPLESRARNEDEI